MFCLRDLSSVLAVHVMIQTCGPGFSVCTWSKTKEEGADAAKFGDGYEARSYFEVLSACVGKA